MALTGHLSDLSLSELIEFFCNQRKTGRLKVLYPQGAGYFYLQTGSVVDARIGVLRGIDAVYFALTLPNAAFEFSAVSEASDRTINQPWTQVVLEGLRRLDEGMIPPEAFPEGYETEGTEVQKPKEPEKVAAAAAAHVSHVPAFLALMNSSSQGWRKPVLGGAVAFAVVISIAVIGVPAGWYGRHKPAATVTKQPAPAASESPAAMNSETAKPLSPASEPDPHAGDAAALATKRQRDKEKAKAREERAGTANASKPIVANTSTSPDKAGKLGPKKAVVTVSYDESGRVTQASGADPTALRIARQKRFPAGKAGTTTITIPLN